MAETTLVKVPVLLYISAISMLLGVCPVRIHFQAVLRSLVSGVAILLFCLIAARLSYAQKEDWLPITQQDLQLKEVPGNPAAPAIQLYYSDFIDDSSQSEFIYRRIKILKDKGKEQADVEIPAGTGLAVRDLKARTIRPDGSIVNFEGKPFDKTLFKSRGLKVLVKSFTLPEVGIGSIIEYKYRLQWEETLTTDNWTLQHDLFTVKENFSFKPFHGLVSGEDFEAGSNIAWVCLHVTKDQMPHKTRGDQVELELENVRAFEPEEYMPPEDNYKPSVHFYYLNSEIKTADSYWDHLGKRWYEAIEKFIGNSKEARQAAMEAVGNETFPENKLRKLYARAQQIRNLSYEHERTEQEMKKENLKDNEGISQVFQRGYGDRWDIVRAFVAMARAAGFEASILRVSDRSDEFFVKEVLSSRQLAWEIADVKLNGEDIYLDPGTKYCPYGLLPWVETSTLALKLDKKNPTFVRIPSFTQEKALIKRRVAADLSPDGSLKAVVQVQFEGLEALDRRLDALEMDEAGRKQELEEEIESWLPSGAVVKLKNAQGWDATDDPLVANFSVEISSYASTAGKRIMAPSYLFQMKHKGAFSHSDRKYPVYFPYAFAEVDAVSIKLPAGYTMESTPQNQNATLPYARYQSVQQLDANQLTTQRALLVNGLFFDIDKYSEVKDFFNKVQAGDEQQAVLHVGGANSASKGN